MARLPWLIRTRFWVPRNFFQENKYLGNFCHFIMKLYVDCSEAILMNTLNIQLLYRRSKRFPLIIHHLLPDIAPGLILNGSYYPYLEQIFMVQKRFEPSKFDCISITSKDPVRPEKTLYQTEKESSLDDLNFNYSPTVDDTFWHDVFMLWSTMLKGTIILSLNSYG